MKCHTSDTTRVSFDSSISSINIENIGKGLYLLLLASFSKECFMAKLEWWSGLKGHCGEKLARIQTT
jgi:hypothetical protein